jgi:cation:H+ antiporter
VLDAFSGSAVVAYMYKTKGLQVIANDRLRYCHHAAKAIIENNSVRLSEDEIELLIVSSRVLVWGAVEIAHGFGVSDLIIGLTVVAVGTSLPELASSIIAARKGEHDIALGNILGSNLFNTLAVVGITGTIHPLAVGPEVFNRDILVMAALTLSLFVIGYGFRGPGLINHIEGAVLLVCYVGYTAYLISTVFGGQA